MNEQFKKIQYITVVNIEWLDETLSSPCNTEDSGKELFERCILATVIMLEDKIYKVLLHKKNKDKIKWGNIIKCYIKADEPVYISLEIFRENINEVLISLKNKEVVEIPAWKFKTFGLYTHPALV